MADPTAPPVVAAVVASDPGDWFGETLDALAAQDYPNLSVLVIDVGDTDATELVAARLPTAFVHRVGRRLPFGTAANQVTALVEGASHLFICHDDVAPAPDAVRLMVEEAFRSNAGVVTPKLVHWDAPDRLAAVGIGVDRFGVVHPLVEPGELDQEQHDGVRDVFVAPSAAALVRADLFGAVGGFSDDAADHGDDLDLSWRIRVAGARIVTAPLARVRHLGASEAGLRAGTGTPSWRRAARQASERHRLHTVLTCTSLLRLVLLAPLLVLHGLLEAAALAAGGRGDEAGVPLRALGTVARHPRAVIAGHRRVHRSRQVPDREIGELQSRGSVRLRTWARARLEQGPAFGPALADDEAAAATLGAAAGAPSADPAPSPVSAPASWRVTVAAVVAVAVLLLVGSRSLLGAPLPVLGQLPTSGGSVGAWWSAWWSTWRTAGLGSTGSGPPGTAVLALAASLLGRSAAVHLAVLGPLVAGPIGAARLARPWGSPRARVAAAAAYATVPVPYDALAGGRWGGVVAYGLAPWVLAAVAALTTAVPHPVVGARAAIGRLAGLAALVALGGAVAPSYLVAVAVAGLGMGLGSLLVRSAGPALRAVIVAVLGAAGAVVLLAPWSLVQLADRSSIFGPDAGPAGYLRLASVLELRTGPVGGLLGVGLLVAAALPLVVGREWRLAWAARLWGVALVGLGWVWAGGRGWLPVPAPEVVLAMAAAGLVGAVALGVVAFEFDLPGYRLGWPQVAAALAAMSAVAAAVPAVVAAADGRWHVPSSTTPAAVTLPGDSAGDYRVLWAGAPAALPLPARQLAPGLAFATSFDGTPGAPDELEGPPAAGALAADLNLVTGRLTTRAGHLLAAAGVRFVVVPSTTAVGGATPASLAPPASLLQGLARQTDLFAEAARPGVTVFENTAWVPVRAVVPAGTAMPARPGARALQAIELPGATGAPGGGQRGARVTVPAGAALYLAEPPGWRAAGARSTATASPALDVGSQVAASADGGGVRLRPPAAAGWRAGQLAEVLLWAVVATGIVVDRRRRRQRADELADPAWFAHEVNRRARRHAPAGRANPVFEDDDAESWPVA